MPCVYIVYMYVYTTRIAHSPSSSTSARTPSAPASSCSTSSTTCTGTKCVYSKGVSYGNANAHSGILTIRSDYTQLPPAADLRPPWKHRDRGERGRGRVPRGEAQQQAAGLLPHHVHVSDALGARRAAAQGLLRQLPYDPSCELVAALIADGLRNSIDLTCLCVMMEICCSRLFAVNMRASTTRFHREARSLLCYDTNTQIPQEHA